MPIPDVPPRRTWLRARVANGSIHADDSTRSGPRAWSACRIPVPGAGESSDGSGSQCPVRRQGFAGHGNLGRDQFSLGATTSPNYGSPVRTEFERHTGVWAARPRLPSIRPISPFMSISVKCSRDGVLIRASRSSTSSSPSGPDSHAPTGKRRSPACARFAKRPLRHR